MLRIFCRGEKRPMKKLRDFFSCYYGGIKAGTAIAVVLFYVMLGYKVITTDDLGFLKTALAIVSVHICLMVLCCIMAPPHRFDKEIIGRNFLGPSAKSRLFRKSTELYFGGDPRRALDGFLEIGDRYENRMKDSEKAVLDFYIAMCYFNMGFYPNANRYFLSAKEKGFDTESFPIWYARCLCELGDMDEAIEVYKGVMDDEKNYFSIYARTDLGFFYLRHNKPGEALVWINEALDRHENYAEALAAASLAYLLLHDIEKGEEYHRLALLNHVQNSGDYNREYRQIHEAVIGEVSGRSGNDDAGSAQNAEVR